MITTRSNTSHPVKILLQVTATDINNDRQAVINYNTLHYIQRPTRNDVGHTSQPITWQAKQYRKKYKLNTTRRKQARQNPATQNYHASVASYDTRPGNETCLFYNAP